MFFLSDGMQGVPERQRAQKNSATAAVKGKKLRGATLCLPAGQSVYELDQGGRNWVKDGKVALMRPPTVDECFRLLDNGTAEGVVATEFAGRATILPLRTPDKIRLLAHPLPLPPLHIST